MFNCVVTFPCHILVQVLYFIVWISDLCGLSYFDECASFSSVGPSPGNWLAINSVDLTLGKTAICYICSKVLWQEALPFTKLDAFSSPRAPPYPTDFVLLLLISPIVLWCSLFWYALFFCNHLDEEERAGCFAFIVFRMSCYFESSVALLHGAVGWSAAYDCGIS